MKSLKLILILLLIPILASARNYYVSNSGDDSKSGSINEPWKTLFKIQNTSLIAGDTVFLKAGNIFYESLTISNKNGTTENPIVITSYGDGKAIISGSKEVEGWIKEDGNIWSLNVSDEVFQVFKDGLPLTTARIPEIVGKYAGEDNFYHITSVVNANYTFISEDLIGAPDLTGATLHVGTWEWLLKTAVISSFDSSTGKVTVKTDIFDVFQKHNRFFINAHKNLLNSEGDWYYDEAAKKLYLYASDAPKNIFVADKSGNGLSVNGGSHIKIKNISVQHFNENGIFSSGTHNIYISDCLIDYNYDRGIYTKDGSQTRILNCELTGTTKVGILNYNPTSIVRECYIHDIGLANQLNKNGFETGYAISSYGKNDTLTFNKLEDIGYNGLELKNFTIVKNNSVKYVNLTTIDGGAIYSYRGNGGHIEDNIVICHPNISELRSHGIYMDNYTHDTKVLNNTVIGFNNNIFINKGAYNIQVSNNTSYGATNAGFLVTTARGIDFKRNKIFITKSKVPPLYVQGISNWNDFVSDSNYYYASNGFVTAYNYLDAYYGLTEWTKLTGNDKHSIENETQIQEFSFSETDKTVHSSSFDSSPTGWTYWSSTAQLVVRDNNEANKCVYDTLSSGKTTGNMFIKGLKIEEGKDYLLEFDLKTSRTSLAQIDFSSESKDKYLDNYRIFVKPEWQHYSIMIKNANVASQNAQLAFYCGYSTWSHSTPNAFFIDNVRLSESIIDESSKGYQIVFNDTKAIKRFPLNGVWKTLQGSIISNAITLNPFSSEIIIKSEQTTQAFEENIDLKKGWNIFSFHIFPENNDFMNLFQKLIEENKLEKVQDEAGNTIEYMGVSQGWINNIGTADQSKAYKIKVKLNSTLIYMGYIVEPLDSIAFSKGWNLIPYNFGDTIDGLTFLKPLIDEGNLIKVVDEAGNTIEPSINNQWINSIGDFIPGKGYEIKVTKNTVLTF